MGQKDVEERHRREDRKSMPSGERNVSERQWGTGSFNDPVLTCIFSLAIFQVGAPLTQCWRMKCEPKIAGLGFYFIGKTKPNKKQKLTQFFNIAPFHLTILIAWNMEEKLEIWQPHCDYKVQSQHTKVGAAERQKGPGSLESVLRSVTMALNCLPTS